MKTNQTGAEQFLRNKTTSLYEINNQVVDVNSGEIIRQERQTKARTSTEPDYIKVYYQAMMAVHDITDVPIAFILGLADCINYANKDTEAMLFFNNKTTRRKLADIMGVTDSMIAKYIKKCTDCGVLFKTTDRGTYEVNPWLIAKGKWDNIKILQTKFDFINNRWERITNPVSREPEEYIPEQ